MPCQHTSTFKALDTALTKISTGTRALISCHLPQSRSWDSYQNTKKNVTARIKEGHQRHQNSSMKWTMQAGKPSLKSMKSCSDYCGRFKASLKHAQDNTENKRRNSKTCLQKPKSHADFSNMTFTHNSLAEYVDAACRREQRINRPF